MKKLASFAVLAMMSGSLLAAPQPWKEEPRRDPAPAGRPHKPAEPRKANRAGQPKPPQKAEQNRNMRKTKKNPSARQHRPAPRPDGRR